MTLEIAWTILVIVAMLYCLIRSVANPHQVLFGALALLLLTGMVSPQEAFSGFSNPAVVTVGLLFIVSAAIQNSGALNRFVYNYLGSDRRKGIFYLVVKMMIPVAALSAFLNNTAIVAIFSPVLKRWTEKNRLPASKFFIPLSYATVLGGIITLIGTSTNLVVHGLMLQNGLKGISLFELAKIGLPCTVAGMVYIAFIGIRLLPIRKDVTTIVSEKSREYAIEMKVTRGCELIGKSIKDAGLRNLKGLFLIDIERKGASLGPISSAEVIHADDRLMFVGVTSAVLDLQNIPGLVPSAHKMFEEDFASMRTHLVEAVISANSPIIGMNVKEAGFRERYGAGVVAIHRNGERINAKIGEIELKPGDTLLLFTGKEFVKRWQNSEDFYLISYLKDKAPDVSRKAPLILAITVLMVLGMAFEGSFTVGGRPFGVLHFVLAAVAVLFATGCIQPREAKSSVKTKILIAIACSFGISKALQNSGAAQIIADFIIFIAGRFGPYGTLIGIYVLTNLFTEIMTHNAAVALVFPIALSAAKALGVNPHPFMIAITVAGSAGFSTPIGYQTHLMVQGPGGYKFSDYLRVGPPLNLICFLVSAALIPLFWPFQP